MQWCQTGRTRVWNPVSIGTRAKAKASPSRGRTLMRSPVVKRQTLPMSGVLAFFPQFSTWCRQSLATCFDFISIEGADNTCLHRTLIEALSPGIGDCRETQGGPLWPRNFSVPSCRPMQKDGCTAGVRQLAAGSGEGQHTSTVDDHHHI